MKMPYPTNTVTVAEANRFLNILVRIDGLRPDLSDGALPRIIQRPDGDFQFSAGGHAWSSAMPVVADWMSAAYTLASLKAVAYFQLSTHKAALDVAHQSLRNLQAVIDHRSPDEPLFNEIATTFRETFEEVMDQYAEDREHAADTMRQCLHRESATSAPAAAETMPRERRPHGD